MTTLSAGPLSIDLSRQPEFALAHVPAREAETLCRAADWLAGKPVNESEHRMAMHMALRAQSQGSLNGALFNDVLKERDRQKNFVLSCTAKTILHIGIGGSELGPRLVYESWQNSQVQEREVIFLSTLTPDTIEATIKKLNPLETMVILTSKSFTTDETSYLLQVLTEAFSWPKDRVIVATAAPDKARTAGFSDKHIFPFWNWVGGRYSVWSSVGLSLALAFGWFVFESFLQGADALDQTLYDNVTTSPSYTLAKLSHAHRTTGRRPAMAVLPYHDGLRALPAYLQQLIMESNGKPADEPPAPIVFGACGTNFQHSFGQFLHQGPDLCLSVFIDVAQCSKDEWKQGAQDRQHANAVAQADMLWQGDAHPDAPHKTLPGRRPSIFITMPDTGPHALGALLALFEHMTVLDGFLSGINPFDQWGVEAAKKAASSLLKNGS